MTSKYQDPLVVDPANGVVRGADMSMPDRGTSSGFVGSDSYGADVSENATNRMGSAHTPSDPMERCYPQGDGRFSSSGHSTRDPGSDLAGTESDPINKERADNERV